MELFVYLVWPQSKWMIENHTTMLFIMLRCAFLKSSISDSEKPKFIVQ